MRAAPQNTLTLEPLESRRLLSVVWQSSDIDGDKVVVRLSGDGDFDVITSELGLGRQIEAIEVFDTSARSKLSVKAYKKGGDGFVDVGEIIAGGEALKQIKVDGNLGYLDIDRLDKLTALRSETLDGEPADWFIGGNMKKIHLKGDLDTATVQVGGSLKKATVEGDIFNASLLIDGWLSRLRVYGDIAEDSLVSVLGDVGSIKVDGVVDFSTIETQGQLKSFRVNYDIWDSEIFAAQSIRRLVVDGAVDNTLIESQGRIRKIDVWDVIVDSDILAGPEGIGTLYAYDLINTVIETDGNIDRLFLDVDW